MNTISQKINAITSPPISSSMYFLQLILIKYSLNKAFISRNPSPFSNLLLWLLYTVFAY